MEQSERTSSPATPTTTESPGFVVNNSLLILQVNDEALKAAGLTAGSWITHIFDTPENLEKDSVAWDTRLKDVDEFRRRTRGRRAFVMAVRPPEMHDSHYISKKVDVPKLDWSVHPGSLRIIGSERHFENKR